MLALKPLREDQYRQVAEWKWGPLDDGIDWAGYVAEMNAPQWAHFGLHDGAELIGRVSFERINSQTMCYHVVTNRHKVHPQALAQVLLRSVQFFFRRGFTELQAHIPKDNVAAARLALRCGMREYERSDTERRFTLERKMYA